METCWKPQGIVTSVVSPQFPFRGNPYVVSTRFPHLETVNPRIPPRFPELETWGKPLCGFHQVSTPGNSQPEDSIQFPRIGNFRKLHRWFPRVSTPGNSQTEDSTLFLQETLHVFFTSFHSCKILVKFTDTYKLYLTADFSHTCTMFPNHQFHNNYYLIKGNEHDNWTENIMHLSIFGYLYVKMFDKRRMYIY